MSDVLRTVLITGATSGIGLEAARRLAGRETTVVLHSRTADEGEQALEELVKTGTDPLRLKLVVADFTHLDEVRALAEQICREHHRLDVLINNAATLGPGGRVLTADGHELTLQVNYLAPYLLTRLLRDLLPAAPAGRVVNVSSSLHRSGLLHWSDLDLTGRYARVAAYAQSKLGLTMFTRALAEDGPSAPVAVAVHPGIVATSLIPIYGRVGGPAGEGAAVVAHFASRHVQVHTGTYYRGLTQGRPAPIVEDRASIGRLWKLSARLTGLA